MPLYRYKAVSEDGRKLVGYYETESQDNVLSFLRNDDCYPIVIEESTRSDMKLDMNIKKVSKKDMAIFCRQLYTMLNAGISIIDCLGILEDQIKNKILARAIFSISKDVQKGMTLSESMEKHGRIFQPILINMVEVGETSGTLDLMMERMAIHYERENEIENKVKSAMIYPLILSTLSIIVVAFLLTVVMPTFVGMFESSHAVLPMPTRILLIISDWLRDHWYILFGILFIIVVGLRIFGTTSRGRLLYDNIKIRLPILKKINIKIITSRFTRTMSTLLSSGIPLLQAIDVTSKVLGNVEISRRLSIVKLDIRRGISMSLAIEKMHVFAPMVITMIRVGEESGAIDETFNKTADFYDDEVKSSIQRMIVLLEPVLTVVMAIIIGFIVISMSMPMFDMVNTIEI